MQERIIKENERRNALLDAPYDPILGLGGPIERQEVTFSDISFPMFLPVEMLNIGWVNYLANVSSLSDAAKEFNISSETLLQQIVNERYKHDFEFWSATTVKIKPKKGGDFIPFVLNRPQRKMHDITYRQIVNNEPIRQQLLKSRQFGGSTYYQIFMGYIQVIHKTSWNSLIAAHLNQAATNIRYMFSTLAKYYPKDIESSFTLKSFERTNNIKIIPERNCKITIGSIETPDSIRADDVALFHGSEIGLWKKTEGKGPEDLCQAILGTIPTEPWSMYVLESTAKGVGNFFHRSWQNAVSGSNGLVPVFVSWLEDPKNRIPFRDIDEMIELYNTLSGYEHFLWEQGATLEGIKFYRFKLKELNGNEWAMKSEFPTTPEEAFQSTGQKVFSPAYIQALYKDCMEPEFKGDVFADARRGPDALKNIRFDKTKDGNLWIWTMPDFSELIENRYCAFADIGGRTEKADYSVIKVFDRYWMMDGGSPEVVAIWKGHCFVPETKIYTSKGFKEIRNIEVGDFVWTHKNRFKKVVKKYVNKYEGNLITIRSQGNYETVRCTPEHPFYSNNVIKKKKKRRKFYKGIKCYSYSFTEQIGEEKWIEAKNLQYVAYSKFRKSQKRTPFIIEKYNGGKSKNTNRKIEDLESLFSVMGYYLAEGHIDRRNKDKTTPSKVIFSFGYHEKETVVKNCVTKLKNLGLSPKIKDSKDVGVCRVKVNDTYFASLLLKLCGEHSWGKMIAPEILKYSKGLLSILLDSYWQGDGSTFTTDNSVSNTVSTVSPILARQVRDILIWLGYRPGLYRINAKTTGASIKSKRPRYNIVWSVSKRKKSISMEDNEHIAYKLKTKKTEYYSGNVYNLEIEEDNSYSTENYIVHNCDQDLFAWKCAQICTMFGNALLAVEVNSLAKEKADSEGEHFLTVLDEIADHYKNLYTRNDIEKVGEDWIPKYGFHTNAKTKPMIINALNAAARERYLKDKDEDEGFHYIERDSRSVDEMASYEVKPDGTLGAVEGAHDDLVIVTAGGVWLSISYMPLPRIIQLNARTTKRKLKSEASF